MKIIIKSPSFQDTPLPMQLNQENPGKVQAIRLKVSQYTKRIPKHIKILLKGRILEDQISISQLKINEDEVFHAVIKKYDPEKDGKKQQEPLFDEKKYTQGLDDLGLEGKVGRDFIDREAVKDTMSKITIDQIQKVVAGNKNLQQLVAKNPQLGQMFADQDCLAEFFRPEMVHAALNQIYGIEGLDDFYDQEQIVDEIHYDPKKPKKNYRQQFKQQLLELRKYGFLNQTQNIETLIATKGDFKAAKQKLMEK